MNETFVMSEQQLRNMALNAMLLAIDAQSAALHSMDREHSLGVENGFSIDRLRSQAKDLLQSTQTIVQTSQSLSLADLRDKIAALASASRRLKGEADRFKDSSQSRARARYEHLLMMLGDDQDTSTEQLPAGKAPTDTKVGWDTDQLSAQAGKACLRAEIDEFEAFSLQIHAICNLALEYALNEAVKSARSNSNI